MTSINSTGASVNFKAVSGGDIVRTYIVQSAGSVRNLTNATIEVVVEDVQDNCAANTIGTYPQEITDAPNGEFTFKIPYLAMVSKSGEEMTYKLFITEGGNRICHQSGMITVLEIV